MKDINEMLEKDESIPEAAKDISSGECFGLFERLVRTNRRKKKSLFLVYVRTLFTVLFTG